MWYTVTRFRTDTDNRGGKLAMLINTVEELEDALSTPSSEDVASVSTLSGDILILGVAGKMGPTLAKLIRRAVEQSKRPRNVTAVSRFSDLSVKSDLEKHGIK